MMEKNWRWEWDEATSQRAHILALAQVQTYAQDKLPNCKPYWFEVNLTYIWAHAQT